MIRVLNLTKTYKSKKQTTTALNNVNLTFGDSGMVFVLGKSGCGKTTLLNMLGAIDGFDDGEIVVDGQKLSEMTEKERCAFRNSYVGFVFQEYNLIDDYNIEENVAIAQELQRKQSSEEVSGILKQLDISDLGKRQTSELSGGQRQRAAIARALVKNPRIILADEPTGALDSESGENLMRLLKEISKERLVVIVSHDRDFAERFGDRIIELKDGKVIGDNAPITEKERDGTLALTFAKLKTSRAIGMGVRTAFNKPIRFATAVLLLAITVCLLGISSMVALFDRDMAIKRTIYNASREYTVETARYVTGGTNISWNGSFDIRLLMDDSDLVKYTEFTGMPCLGFVDYSYYYENNIAEPPSHDKWAIGDWGMCFNAYTALTEQTVRDFGFELRGYLPKADNEIVITEYILRSFMDYGYTNGESEFTISSADDMIGKTLTLRDWRLDYVDYTVCGVIINLDFDKESFDIAIDSTPEPYLKANLKKESEFYERFYPYKAVFFSPDRFNYHKEHTENVFSNVGLIKRDTELDSSNRDLYIQKNGKDISSLGLLVFESDKYNDGITKEVLFKDSCGNGQCVLSLYEFFAFIAENDITLDVADRVAVGCTSLYEYINKYFYNIEKIGQIIEEDYNELINEWYTKEDRVEQAYRALHSGSYDIFGTGIAFVERLYNDIACMVAKYAYGAPVRIGGSSAMVKDFALAGIVFEKDTGAVLTNGLLCLSEADAEEISYGAYDNYYDYLIAKMPKQRTDMNALYDDGFSSNMGLHFAMENFEKDAVSNFELQLTVAQELCTVVCCVLAVFAVILLFNFILSSIAFRKNDIRIFKNLGAGKSEIYKIFFMESLLTILLAFVLGIAAVGVGIYVFNAHYASFIHPALVALTFEWFVPFILFGGALAISIVVFLISMGIRRI